MVGEKKKKNRNAELNRSILKDLDIVKNNYAKKRTIRKTIQKKERGKKKTKSHKIATQPSKLREHTKDQRGPQGQWDFLAKSQKQTGDASTTLGTGKRALG